MTSKYKSVKLTEILQFLDGKEENNKPFLFVNPTGTLETFFTYKALLIDIFKMKMNLQLKPEKKPEIQNELQTAFEGGMKIGNWLVFNLGRDSTFDLVGFLKQFPFYDKDMFQPDKIKDKKYCLNHKILREENDVDVFGNKGFFEIKESFKFCFLCLIKENEIDDFFKTNSELNFDVIIAQ